MVDASLKEANLNVLSDSEVSLADASNQHSKTRHGSRNQARPSTHKRLKGVIMYYEEKIIDGVLCWRNSPDGEWIQKTHKRLKVG